MTLPFFGGKYVTTTACMQTHGWQGHPRMFTGGVASSLIVGLLLLFQIETPMLARAAIPSLKTLGATVLLPSVVHCDNVASRGPVTSCSLLWCSDNVAWCVGL